MKFSQILMICALTSAILGAVYTAGTLYVWKRLYRPWLSITATTVTTVILFSACILALAGCSMELGCRTQVPSDAASSLDSSVRPNPLRMSGTSADVTWDCIVDIGDPCPWGPTLRNQAIVWPAVVGPANDRLGYRTTEPVYLLARVAHVRVTITKGEASVYVGKPMQMGKFPAIAALSAGQSYVVIPLEDGVVMSVESSGDAFQFEVEPL